MKDLDLNQLQISKEKILQDLQMLNEKYETKEKKIIKEVKYCEILKRYFKNNVQKFNEYTIILKIITKNLNINIREKQEIVNKRKEIEEQIKEIQKEISLIKIHKEELKKQKKLRGVIAHNQDNKTKRSYVKVHPIKNKIQNQNELKSKKIDVKVDKVENYNENFEKDLPKNSIYEQAYNDMIRRIGTLNQWFESSCEGNEKDFNKSNNINLSNKLKIRSIILQEYNNKYLNKKIIQINNKKFLLNRILDNKTKKELDDICKNILQLDKFKNNSLKKIILLHKIKSKIDPAIVNCIKDYYMYTIKKCDEQIEFYSKINKSINLKNNVQNNKLKNAYKAYIKAKEIKKQCKKMYKETVEHYINSLIIYKSKKKFNSPFNIIYDFSENITIYEYNKIKKYINVAKKIGAKILGEKSFITLLKENFKSSIKSHKFISEENFTIPKYIEGDKSFITKVNVKQKKYSNKIDVINQNQIPIVSKRQISI